MTRAQRDAFLEAASGEPRYFALFATLVKTGLRPGEGFALQPGDLELRRGVLRVERAWVLGRIKGTKTHEERTVDLSRGLAILERRRRCVVGGGARVALSERAGHTA